VLLLKKEFALINTMSKNKIKIILLFILLVAFFLRLYNFRSLYNFSHDQDLASWIIKDIIENKHLRLIGQETSSSGVFIGALFYYLQIPFYVIGQMDPLYSLFLPIILGVFATYSVYFVVGKIFNLKVALISSFIYGFSSLVVGIDREVAPTMPVMLWSVWYLYSVFLVYKKKQMTGFLLWGLLLGFIWHFNLALLIVIPLIFLPFVFGRRPNLKAIFMGGLIAIILNIPFILFEYRHNFVQTKSIFLSLTTSKDYVENTATGINKLDRVMQLVTKNSMAIFSRDFFVKPNIFFYGLVFLFLYLVFRKKINSFYALLFLFWQISYIFFFSLNSLNVSEYYFNGMNIIWIIIFSLGVSELYLLKKTNKLALFLIFVLFIYNFWNVVKIQPDKKGYIEKRDLVREIKSDSIKHNYPCVSISYITKPGYDLGYRYLFYLEKMHVNKPISQSPVYTIVFPHSMVDKIDKAFGSLGLIYPDYDSYNEKEVLESCSGENSNLTDPMLGYTQ